MRHDVPSDEIDPATVVPVFVSRSQTGKLVVVPAKNYGHDLEGMLAAVTPNTRIIFVANPNNPTGTRVSSEDLARFVAAGWISTSIRRVVVTDPVALRRFAQMTREVTEDAAGSG